MKKWYSCRGEDGWCPKKSAVSPGKAYFLGDEPFWLEGGLRARVLWQRVELQAVSQ